MKVAVISPDFFRQKKQLKSPNRLRRLLYSEEVEKIYHLYRGSATPFSEGNINHIKLGDKSFENKYLENLRIYSLNLWRELKKLDIDLVYHLDLLRLPLAGTVHSLQSLPYVCQIGADLQWFTHNSNLWKTVITPFLKKSKKVVFLANHLRQQWGKLDINSEVIYPVIGLEQFFKTPINISKNEILYIGRIEKPKGVLRLLNVVPSLVDKIPDIKVRIIGDTLKKGSLYYKSFLSKFKSMKNKFPENITWEGWVEQNLLSKYYREASLTVLPSHTESFNSVLAESMATGTPVVLSDIPVYRELIANFDSSLLSSMVPNKLCNKITDFLNDKEKLHKLGENGKRYMKNLKKRYEDKWKNLFSNIKST